ncbi:hypothetical protein, partial [Rhizobium johnstonii]|uniref:hypothetical protein n=1 Tax=Rhizobium johnstonii TaxID=3019933 RepID=UPI003F98187F
ITDTIASQGQELLAGDFLFELNNREATPQEIGFLEVLGSFSVSTGLRSIVRLGHELAVEWVGVVDGLDLDQRLIGTVGLAGHRA